jgi:opacity protein-like surface antigen
MRGKRFTLCKSAVIPVAAILFLLSAAPPAAAQGSNLRFTLFGAGSFLKADRTFPAEGETYHTEFAAGGRAGIRATLDITGHFSVEGSYAYGTNNFRLSNLNQVPPLVRGFGTSMQQIDGDVLYFLSGPRSRMRPFATVGFGILRVSPSSAAKAEASTRGFIAGPATLSSGNKFDFNYGFGVEQKLASYFGLRVDLHDYVLSVPRLGAPPGPGAPGAGFFPVSGLAHDVEIAAGIVIYTKP